MDALIRVFGYLKKYSKGSIIIDPKYPDHHQFDNQKYYQWKVFYSNAAEDIPHKDMIPTPLGNKIRITVYKDADHAHDLVTRR